MSGSGPRAHSAATDAASSGTPVPVTSTLAHGTTNSGDPVAVRAVNATKLPSQQQVPRVVE